jgi:hypothetical protein
VKRLVVCAACAVVSCSSVVLVTAMSPPAAAGRPALVSDTFMRAPRPAHVRAGVVVDEIESPNWSGYVQGASDRGTFTEATDTIVVPSVDDVGAGTQYAADWVGIGGYFDHDRSLVQTGVQAVVSGAGSVSYDAWTEILPQAERPLKLKVTAGDKVTATVEEIAADQWTMTVDDLTTGKSGSRTVKYRSKGLSAEAIHERPCIANPCSSVTSLAQLAQTDDVTFDPGYASESPAGAPPANEALLSAMPGATLTTIAMVSNAGSVIATPSVPNGAEDGFTMADGAAPPLPPGS